MRAYLILSALLFLKTGALVAEGGEILDIVVASVDGDPITLNDLGKRLERPISPREISANQSVKEGLEAMILEKVIEGEAKKRGLAVADEEIEQYIGDVAKKNEMDVSSFQRELASSGTSVESYRKRVRLEILKSKITAISLRGGVAISDEEVKRYIDEHRDEFQKGSRLKLAQIFLSKEKHPDEKGARKVLRSIRKKIVDDDAEFAEMAKKYSDAPESKEGGMLGIVVEKDLDPLVFDELVDLDEDEVSDIVTTSAGHHLFLISERIDEEEELTKEEVARVKEMLVEQHLEMKLATFIDDELMKEHAVDRKL
jgi:peptidyl-prolyl cis-trans isomerase SurA